MSDYTKTNLFERENNILEEACNVSKSAELKDCKLLEKYKRLTKEYKKLLKQSVKIINISDSQHKYLNELQHELKLILDNTGQCIFTTNEELIIEDNYSAECIKLFGEKIENKKFTELIKEYNTHDNIEVIEEILNRDIFKENEFKRQVLLMILPEEILYKDKILSLECKLITSDLDKPSRKFLFLLTDISENKLLEEKIKDEQYKFETATRIISNNNLFKKLLKEYMYFSSEGLNVLLNGNLDKVTILKTFMKEIHTFKGNFSMFGMSLLVQKLHEIEESIIEMKEKIESLSHKEIINNICNYELKNLMQDYLDKLSNFIDKKYLESEEKEITISREKLNQIEKTLEQIGNKEAQVVLNELNKLKLIDFSVLLHGYPQYVLKLAQKDEKLVHPFNIESKEYIPVDEKKYYKFTKSLVNVFRNAVKHGIELPCDRAEFGKNEIGNIGCSISKDENKIIIQIFDDGCGIDIDKLNSKALLENKTSDKLFKISTFNDGKYVSFGEGISTLDRADEVGGRGEGMVAVINELNNLGGKLEINTEIYKGTTLRFILPYI